MKQYRMELFGERQNGERPLARSITGIRRTGLHAAGRWQVGAGPIEISAFEACEAAAGGDGAQHIGVAEGLERLIPPRPWPNALSATYNRA